MIVNPFPKYTNGKLIFDDGRQLLREFYSIPTNTISKVKEDSKLITESINQGNLDHDNLVMNCILQKCEIENRNGRWYPRNVLERENNNYQQLIEEGRGLGHDCHPDCHTSGSYILTRNGWELLDNLQNNTEVLTLNTITNKPEYQKIIKKIEQHYEGDTIHIKGNRIDVEVTPNHRFWVLSRNGKGRFVTAQEIYDDSITSLDHMFIPKKSNGWDQKSDDYFVVPGLKYEEVPFSFTPKKKIEMTTDLKVPMDTWMMFMGIYLSEGCAINPYITKVKKKMILENGDKEVVMIDRTFRPKMLQITQKKPENIFLIEQMLEKFPLDWKKKTRKSGTVDFKVFDCRLHKYLLKLGKCYEKYIPTEIKNQSTDNLKLLFEWFFMGDGRYCGNKKMREVFSTSKQLIEDLHEVMIKCGMSGNVKREKRDKDRIIRENGVERIIKGENSRDMWFLSIANSNGVWIRKKWLDIKKVKYKGPVYCVTVPNQVFYTMRNGKSCWNGNSSLVEFKDSSHRIIKTWWDENTLMGKIEILASPGFFKMGICSVPGDIITYFLGKGVKMGISSRGVGSLKEQNGKNIVQDDFELIAFDLVSSPSTPGAFLFDNNAEMAENIQEGLKNKIITKKLIDPFINNLDEFLK